MVMFVTEIKPYPIIVRRINRHNAHKWSGQPCYPLSLQKGYTALLKTNRGML